MDNNKAQQGVEDVQLCLRINSNTRFIRSSGVLAFMVIGPRRGMSAVRKLTMNNEKLNLRVGFHRKHSVPEGDESKHQVPTIRFTFSYVNIKRPTHKVGQVYTKIDIKPSGLTKERLAFMKTQMRLLYDDK